ncbi:MAG: Rpn family recombination-promoting nuclease/putative transposase [Bacteroidota bacterium]
MPGNKLALTPSNAIDRANTNVKLKKRRKDIVLEAQMKELGTPLVNGEHQSRPDAIMPPRFLQYGADNITPHLREDKEVSLLIQLLVYNEKPAPYPYHSTLQACYK